MRTVQSRMKVWRSTQANALVFGPFADAARTEIVEVVQ
ncbi:transposase [Mesorhizobium amorphae CCNWGS0123]|uniref:Transposase n=1 Tax=Mesorhizobium amorphae CCNWGS0123 TaxID=1082933 RepID=G6Y3F1_9HYPH|nr:transposase [Mesorhizobium amorphae CCNWGS0123]